MHEETDVFEEIAALNKQITLQGLKLGALSEANKKMHKAFIVAVQVTTVARRTVKEMEREKVVLKDLKIALRDFDKFIDEQGLG
jgi:hypothetical protein